LKRGVERWLLTPIALMDGEKVPTLGGGGRRECLLLGGCKRKRRHTCER